LVALIETVAVFEVTPAWASAAAEVRAVAAVARARVRSRRIRELGVRIGKGSRAGMCRAVEVGRDGLSRILPRRIRRTTCATVSDAYTVT
jgi:hypothetical protein